MQMNTCEYSIQPLGKADEVSGDECRSLDRRRLTRFICADFELHIRRGNTDRIRVSQQYGGKEKDDSM